MTTSRSAATCSSIFGQDLLVGRLPVGVARLEAELRALAAREVLGAAAELDVDTAAGHVGRDRDGTGDAGLGDDLAFALGVFGLGVQHGVRDAACFASCWPSSSETSTEIVPTRTGWPLAWRSSISLTTACHLPSRVL